MTRLSFKRWSRRLVILCQDKYGSNIFDLPKPTFMQCQGLHGTLPGLPFPDDHALLPRFVIRGFFRSS